MFTHLGKLWRVFIVALVIGVLPVWSKTPVLLELFTSEGCSSCPAADRLLRSLDEKQPVSGAELIVLSEHVDYWNSGAWTDPYSSRLFSARQQSYAEHLGVDDVYTPQMVVDGYRQAVGANAAAVQAAAEAATRQPKVALTIANAVRTGNRMKFRLTSADLPVAEGAVAVYVAVAQNRAESAVSGGENSGRSLSHVAMVRSLVRVAKARSGSPLSESVTISIPSGIGSNGFRVVAFMQSERSNRIIGATYLKM